MIVGGVGAEGVVDLDEAWCERGGYSWGGEGEVTFVFADEGLNFSFAHGQGDEGVAGAEFSKARLIVKGERRERSLGGLVAVVVRIAVKKSGGGFLFLLESGEGTRSSAMTWSMLKLALRRNFWLAF